MGIGPKSYGGRGVGRPPARGEGPRGGACPPGGVGHAARPWGRGEGGARRPPVGREGGGVGPGERKNRRTSKFESLKV